MAETTRPPHLVATTTDRGFDYLPPVPCIWGMDPIKTGEVRVYESSAATSAALWLAVEQYGVAGSDPAEVAAHLRVTDALRVADQLVRAVAEHYHFPCGDLPDIAGDLGQVAERVTEEIGEALRILGADEEPKGVDIR